jgi:hypothetical protein
MKNLFEKLVKILNRSWSEIEKMNNSTNCTNCILKSNANEKSPSDSFELNPCLYCQLFQKLQKEIQKKFDTKLVPKILEIVQDKFNQIRAKDQIDYFDCKKTINEIERSIHYYKNKIIHLEQMNEYYKEQLMKEKQNRLEILRQVRAMTDSMKVFQKKKSETIGRSNQKI